jgi:hypothetical protein
MDLMTSNARREKNVKTRIATFCTCPSTIQSGKKWANLDNYHANTLGLAA